MLTDIFYVQSSGSFEKLHKIFSNDLFIGLKMFHARYKKFENSDELILSMCFK